MTFQVEAWFTPPKSYFCNIGKKTLKNGVPKLGGFLKNWVRNSSKKRQIYILPDLYNFYSDGVFLQVIRNGKLKFLIFLTFTPYMAP